MRSLNTLNRAENARYGVIVNALLGVPNKKMSFFSLPGHLSTFET